MQVRIFFKQLYKPLRTSFNYVKSNWWWILLLFIILVCSVLFFTPFRESLILWAKLLTDVLTPFSILLGIILGYPLLKKKLMEQYVIKQFEIRDKSNRKVRHKVMELLDTYPINYPSHTLTLEYIKTALNQISILRNIALDAHTDVYRYVNLIYKTLKNLEDIYTHYNDDKFPHHNHKEDLSCWLNNQLQEVYDYSKSIGIFPAGETIIKFKLNKTLSPLVTNNQVAAIRDMVHTIEYEQADSMLVLFFDTSKMSLSSNNVEIFKAAFEAAPSACPFARILFNNSIYFPLILKSKEKFWFEYGCLYLVGYKSMKSTNLKGEESKYYECIYANITNIGFVNTTLTKIDKLIEYKDGYLEKTPNFEHFYDLKNWGHEIISMKISQRDAREEFTRVKQGLIRHIKSEL